MNTPGTASNSTARKRDAEAAPVADVETLAEVLAQRASWSSLHWGTLDTPREAWDAFAEAILASDWLAAHDRALLTAVAGLVDHAEPEGEFVYAEGYSDGLDAAARIVWAARSTQ